MLTTKRFDYVGIDQIHLHPSVANHRPLNETKVAHYAEDIARNGLLEPLVVWERNPGEFYLVGGFHRYNAIRRIRETRPGYFDRIDVRVVHGDLDEIQALNLKLNADRLDARITDYFDAVIFMANANWDTARIARFLDKSEAWIEDILKYAPGMDSRIRSMLERGDISWAKAKAVCKAVLAAEAGQERAVLERELDAIRNGSRRAGKVLTYRSASAKLKKSSTTVYNVTGADVLALLEAVSGKGDAKALADRVRKAFPGILD